MKNIRLLLSIILTFFLISFTLNVSAKESIKIDSMKKVNVQRNLEKKKIRFIINPKSGTNKERYYNELIYLYLDHSKFDYEIKYTKGPSHATILSKEAADLGYDIVVGVGGDGTINEVGRGLIGKKCIMGIIPSGSGNGLARHLKIPIACKKAIRVINECNYSYVDTAQINDTYFLGIAGIGFDAHIANEFAKSKKRGFFSYANLVIKEYLKYKSQSFDLIIDGKKVSRDAFLLSFAKSSQYGNNIKIAPHAKIDDGYLYVTILKYPPMHAFLDVLWKLSRGSINKSKYYETIKCKDIKIKKDNTIIHIDGEPISFEKGIDIRVLPKSIKILIPRTKK